MKTKTRGPDRIKGRKGEYPIGTVRLRHAVGSQGNRTCRYIKVRMDGPSQHRWISYAKFIWEATNGPVPPGKVVGRLDGDMLNDDIRNLRLMTMGDVVGLAHIRDVKMSDRNYRKAGKATAKMNRERAHFRRAIEYIPTRWYGVFPFVKQVWNEPRRKRTQILHLCGITDDWRVARSAALGFAGRDLLQACCLFVGHASSLQSLTDSVNRIREFAGWEPATNGAISSALVKLRQEGLFESETRGRYHRTEMADLACTRKTPVIPIRGARLQCDPLFAEFKKVWEIEGVCIRCGCHENDACLNSDGIPCSWAGPGLCSQCADEEPDQ